MIKVLLLIALVFAVIWFIRGARHKPRGGEQGQQRPAPPKQQDMIECPVCQVHLPRSDALPGPDGQLYCCAEHRQRAAG